KTGWNEDAFRFDADHGERLPSIREPGRLGHPRIRGRPYRSTDQVSLRPALVESFLQRWPLRRLVSLLVGAVAFSMVARARLCRGAVANLHSDDAADDAGLRRLCCRRPPVGAVGVDWERAPSRLAFARRLASAEHKYAVGSPVIDIRRMRSPHDPNRENSDEIIASHRGCALGRPHGSSRFRGGASRCAEPETR